MKNLSGNHQQALDHFKNHFRHVNQLFHSRHYQFLIIQHWKTDDLCDFIKILYFENFLIEYEYSQIIDIIKKIHEDKIDGKFLKNASIYDFIQFFKGKDLSECFINLKV